MTRKTAHRLSVTRKRLSAALMSAALTSLAVFGAGTPALADVLDRPFFRAGPLVVVFGASDFLENGGVAPVVGDFILLDDVSTGGSGNPGFDLITGDLRPINFNTQRFNPINNPENAGLELEVENATFGGGFNSAPPNQTLDGNDSFDLFGLDETTDITRQGAGNRASRFFVASNAPFDIFAHATNLTATGSFSDFDYENIRFRFRVQPTGGAGANVWGRRAQDPSVGGDGIVIGGPGDPLATLDDLAGPEPVRLFGGGQRTAAGAGTILDQAVSFRSLYNLRQVGADASADGFDFSIGTGSLAADVTFTIYAP